MFDQADVSNLGEEFERGLRAYGSAFDEKQIGALKTAFEMAMMNALVMIQGRLGK
ncbi:MAG: hypothetical protein ACMUHY_00705 [Thermoplasmatota archaeon]